MSESTLTLGRTELRLAIADYLGYGRTAASWTTNQSARIDVALDDGHRQVYSPMVIPGETTPHKWSFLYPVWSFSTVADQQEYQMPDDFGGSDGDLTFAAGTAYRKIQFVGEGQIRARRQLSSTSGVPMFAAIRPVKSDGAEATRSLLILDPTPDSAWALTMRYRIRPDALSADRPYSIGASTMSQLLKESCLAAAEYSLTDARGIHWQRFTELLMSAIAEDRAHGPEYFGYNGNEDPIPLRRWESRSRSGLIEYGA